jgi:molybdopterin-guanine dinucleotide biosynthesis protein A
MKSHATPKLNALVLIGGQSKRMGQDKSLLDYHGKPQWKHTVSLLENLVDTVYLSVRKNQEVDFPNLIVDKVADIGPFGGILTVLETYPDAAFLVIATDLPFLDKEIIRLLISKRNITKYATALQSENKDYPEPLVCIWEPKSLPILQEYFQKKIYKPIQVLKNLPIHIVKVSNKLVQNINTLNEFRKVQKYLK